MYKTLPLLSNLLLIGILTTGLSAKPMDTPKGDTTKVVDSDHEHLVEAKKRVNEIPEVLSAQQQAKSDRAQLIKVLAEYKQARTKSNNSDDAYRKIFDEQLNKLDPEAAKISARERQAFREKMVKARESKKTDGKKVGSIDSDELDDHVEDES
ncbi:MAG: hypothetical protein EBV82_08145 [Chitinophagia bacterium]|nr:hypothetical protein [Chitinophagia bacterium]